MPLHPKHIENVSKLKSFERYKYVIRKIADYEEFWAIVDKNGDLGLSTIEDKTLISIWSEEDFIADSLNGNWKNHVPFKITLDDFENTIASIIVENDYLLSVFPLNGKTGFVVNVDEFIRDLNEELEQYQ